MRNMTKKIVCTLFSIVMLFTFFVATIDVYATSYATIPSGGKNLRSEPSGNSSLVEKLNQNTKVLLLQANVQGYGGTCVPDKWHKVRDLDNGKEGYICAADVAITEVADVDLNGDFEKSMLNKGFPSSYLPYLKSMHQKHSNWEFIPVKTNLDFNYAVDQEYVFGKSLVDGSDTSLRSKDPSVYDAATNTYKNLNWDYGWYAASWETVSYYMDPRNFINEQYIFMFETLSYNSKFQTDSNLKSILQNTYFTRYSDFNYIDVFRQAGIDYNVSPLHLASRAIQETSANGSVATTGESFVFAVDTECQAENKNAKPWNYINNCGNGKSYSGLYNFFSIGAYGSYMKPAIRGLIWANGGYDGSVEGYGRPWKTPTSAVRGGAEYIAEGYINKGQDTLYFERFNVKPGAVNKTFSNQYMTNVRAHASEAYTNYTAYNKTNSLNLPFEFLIPVYNNMPGETSTAPSVTPQQDPNVPAVSIDTVMGSLGVRYDGSYVSNITPGRTIEELNSAAKRVSSKASVTGKSGKLVTGDRITISNGETSRQYTVVIYGDANGDGKISINDLLRVQKIILKAVNVSEPYTKAADTNKDGKVTIVDLLRVQKHILGSIVIPQ